MSLILEALQKSEHERAVGRVPGLDSTVVIAHALSLRRWKVATFLVVLVNVLAVGGYFLFQGLASKPVAVGTALPILPTTPTGDDDVPVASAPIKSTPDDVASPASQTKASQSQSHQSRAPLNLSARSADATKSEVPAEGVFDIDAVRDIEASRLARQRQTASVPVVEPHPVVTSRAAAETEVTADPSNGAPVSTLELPELAQVRESFSPPLVTLRLDVHVYSPTLNERFVLINMNKYHEGDRLREGPQITAIESTGVVMEYQDQKFVLTAD